MITIRFALAAAAIASFALVQGCATQAPTREWKPPHDLQWFRTSAERRAAYAQAYRLAWERVETGRAKVQGPWAVVMDADETILDNSEYQDRRARIGKGWEQASWDAWTAEWKAVAFPEAVAFITKVRAAGGHVAIVTNRVQKTCDDTARNLDRQNVRFDSIQCAPGPGQNDKQPRFDAVANGAVPGAGAKPMTVVLYVGDSITDCPGQSQQKLDAALFGAKCVVLPNPMYGGWQGNPYR